MRVTASAGASRTPALVWDGTGYGLAWSDNRDGHSGTYSTRLAPSGDGVGQPLRVTEAFPGAEKPCLVWTGTEYGLAWEDGRHFEEGDDKAIYFTRISAESAQLGDDVPVVLAPGYSLGCSLVWTGQGYGLAWQDRRGGGDYQVYFASAAYQRYEQDWACRLQGFRLLFLANTRRRADLICRLARDMTATDFVWITDQDSLLEHGLGGAIWRRGGRTDTERESVLGARLGQALGESARL